jgi:lysyl endopeptidase
MISRFFAVLALAVPLLATAEAPMQMPSRALEGAASVPATFRAPTLAAFALVSLPAPQREKAALVPQEVPGGPIRIGDVREIAQPARIVAWTHVTGGYVARFTVSSGSAPGIRAKLILGTVPGAFDVRVQGSDGSRIESMRIDPELGNEAWTPWTEGSSQLIELFSPVLPSPDAVSVAAIVHFTDSPFSAKAAGTCTLSTLCSSGNATIDAAILERKKSMARLAFTDGDGQFLCTGTMLNSTLFPAPFLITANHCIDNAAAAASLSTFWFYEATSCSGGGVNPAATQVAGGAQIVFQNYNVDSTLVRMNMSPPSGVVYSAWNRAPLANGTSFVSLSHPGGDTSRFALGSITDLLRIDGRPQDMYAVNYTSGIIEHGSSGSGLFVLNGAHLELRGVLSGTTINNSPGGLSCTDLDEQGIYGRFEIFEPEIDAYIRSTPSQAADDAPNRAFDLFNAPVTDPSGVDKPLDLRSSPLVLAGKRIDYAGDVDVFRFSLTRQSSVHAFTTGSLDTVGSILDSNGVNIEANDDEDVSAGHTNFNFGITRALAAGTYYVQVAHYDATGTGAYTLSLAATPLPPNYTDIWWNAAESGWGINFNHQGNVIVGTLFTYDAGGAPMWLIMDHGSLQSDGSFLGELYRPTGPAFNAAPWTAISPVVVGTMRVVFPDESHGTLSYTVNGVSVTKAITREPFSTQPVCTFTTSDRSGATNYQDLWWNPDESGWGINVVQHGTVVFATLFTYDAGGQGKWFVLPHADQGSSTAVFSGTLYTTTGPAFNASPWTGTTPIEVGTMSFNFSSGNAGTLTYSVNGVQVTKQIQREVFSSPTTQCQ